MLSIVQKSTKVKINVTIYVKHFNFDKHNYTVRHVNRSRVTTNTLNIMN